jgi:hypothetical protein
MKMHIEIARAMLNETVYLHERIGIEKHSDAFSGCLAAGFSQFFHANPVGCIEGFSAHRVKIIRVRCARHKQAKPLAVIHRSGSVSW